ncbi:hypothetical protein [Mycobacteroides abscessus]|uniref:hypothetical protein n=1 Tax=Mycobacteroides abscessus TaxID=36809 RepID=UPI000C25E68F|nr:hypothetical protein [Mycobacteroides abscessus]MDO3331637.1 hypothetical protein [Mycobacteroides abscessus subsp. abscessus]
MTREIPKAGPAADLLDAVNSLRAGLMAGADAAVAAAESAAAAAQAHLAVVKSLRAAAQSYDQALSVFTQPNHPNDS